MSAVTFTTDQVIKGISNFSYTIAFSPGFLWVSSLLISAPRLSVTLITPGPAQANTHPKIKIDDSELPLVRRRKLLEMYLDTFFSFHLTHTAVQVANRVSERNNVLKALVGINRGQQNGILLMTYKSRLQTTLLLSGAQMLANIT